jgi:hypothetical protein
MTDKTSLTYTELPSRMRPILELAPSPEKVAKRLQELGTVRPREGDIDGSVEILCGVAFTHHFVEAPGDFETVLFHYVSSGEEQRQAQKAPVVLLHGMPDSWFQWHQHMAALAQDGYLCVAPDLKGYGQSSKEPGDYRHKGAAEQLAAMLLKANIEKF